MNGGNKFYSNSLARSQNLYKLFQKNSQFWNRKVKREKFSFITLTY